MHSLHTLSCKLCAPNVVYNNTISDGHVLNLAYPIPTNGVHTKKETSHDTLHVIHLAL